jgi:thiol:disulfide interchange protein
MNLWIKRLFLGLSLFCVSALLGASATETKVSLVLSADQSRPGETVWAGVHIELAEGWHTYWRYGGEAAQPPEITWDLPDGVTAGEIQWPLPEKHFQSDIYSYIYHHETMLLVPLSITGGERDLTVKARVNWLECKEVCVPQNLTVEAKLVVGNQSIRSRHADQLEQWRSKVPRVDESIPFNLQWDGEGQDDERYFVVSSADSSSKLLDFYPHAYDSFEVMGATESVAEIEGQSAIKKGVFKYDGDWPTEIAGLVELKGEGQDSSELVETVLVFGASSQSIGVSGAEEAVEVASGVGSASTLNMLFFAFIGGFILNFMPCVLPVIALKILGFVKQSEESPAMVKRLGLVYGLGVLASFLVMAGLVVGVQQAGRLASWGMQFQNIGFLVPMMILVTLVSLNFFGVFEISLGGNAMGAASKFSGQEGYLGAFFNGVLATILATPCTAPFLATALGFAFAQPPLWIVLFFLTIACGLAFPYVLLSWNPRLMKYLPKPGPWMGRFKVAMGFPMLATAVWLYSVSLSHFSEGAELWLGLLLVMVSMSAWVWGQFVQQVSVRRPLSIGVALLIGLGGAWWVLEGELDWRHPVAPKTVDGGGVVEKGIEWLSWSHAAVADARSAGHPVLVDFTAKWCQNCQANKRFSIEIDPVREKLKALDVLTFRADFTHYDERIARELEKFDRAGVPLVLVFPSDKEGAVQVLPPLLTPSIVLEALDKAGEDNELAALD